MKTLYLECNMGAAGDMLMAALLELIDDKNAFIAQMNSLGLPGVRVLLESNMKCGVTGSHVRVLVHGDEEVSQDVHDHSHHDHPHSHVHDHPNHDHDASQEHEHTHAHASLQDVTKIIDSLPVSEKVKADAHAVYQIIADAESRVHGHSISDIHFHEVGTLDAVADVVGVCLLMEQIGADQIIASPVHVGSGFVRCAHGVLPVPAPATALILMDVPTYGGQVKGELCTPTGAALLKHFVSSFGDRPVMKTAAIGYGMGSKDFERLNCVRAFLGETEGKREEIVRLECNLDDMTGEALGFAMEVLFANGARDVFTTPIGMKKGRPGVMLSVICLPEDADRLAALMLKHTTTLGVRRQDCSRYLLERTVETVETIYGPLRIKRASGQGIIKVKPEYDDAAAAALRHNVSLQQVMIAAMEAAAQSSHCFF